MLTTKSNQKLQKAIVMLLPTVYFSRHLFYNKIKMFTEDDDMPGTIFG